eukprot:4372630-Pleurochrysis_carterae.AAC.1
MHAGRAAGQRSTQSSRLKGGKHHYALEGQSPRGEWASGQSPREAFFLETREAFFLETREAFFLETREAFSLETREAFFLETREAFYVAAAQAEAHVDWRPRIAKTP